MGPNRTNNLPVYKSLGSQLWDQKTPTMKQNQKETKSTFNLQVEPEVQLQVYRLQRVSSKARRCRGTPVTQMIKSDLWMINHQRNMVKIKSMNPKNQSELLINYDKI
jgi:hypothetical protein